MEEPLANYLKMPKRQEVLALLALRWSFRKIERETGVRRETIIHAAVVQVFTSHHARLILPASNRYKGPGNP